MESGKPIFFTRSAITRYTREDGFTLIEVLVTLALFSVISLVLFDIVSTQYRVQDRTRELTTSVIESQAVKQSFYEIVGQMLPQWREGEPGFIGTSQQFAGISTGSQLTNASAPFTFKMELRNNRQNLNYTERDVSITMKYFSEPASFSYLGADGVWLTHWPPETPPDGGRFNDAEHYTTPPFPRAIRITTENNEHLHIIAEIGWQAPRPFRWQDMDKL